MAGSGSRPSTKSGSKPSALSGSKPFRLDSDFLTGTVCWGHVTGVLEDNTKTFAGNWLGSGEASGSGDSEVIELDAGEYMESNFVNVGNNTIEILQNHYDTDGDDVTLKYRHGATQLACEAASWNVYSGSFLCAGWVQVRIESTL